MNPENYSLEQAWELYRAEVRRIVAGPHDKTPSVKHAFFAGCASMLGLTLFVEATATPAEREALIANLRQQMAEFRREWDQ